ncbi:MAG: homocysteine biosynthesis protein [Desulfovibrionales bacterium]
MATKQVTRTIHEINEKIKRGKAVVLNAREMANLVRHQGKVKAAGEVDIVTTGTFSPMCSSGMFFNFGQEPPLIKASKVWLNGVPAYGGVAAVDAYLGATEPMEDDPLNKVYPGKFKYGGGHVIEDLLRGKFIHLKASGYGTDCYPRRTLDKKISLQELRNAVLVNPRNGYQNYNCAVNVTSKTIYTYMGPLKANLGNANYATSGELSPLFNDPLLRTIGVGTRIFLGGGTGYVMGAGTQHNGSPVRNELGLPLSPAATLMVTGDLKQMDAHYLRGVSILGYGPSLAVGLGIPIPILDEEMAGFTGVCDADIQIPVVDYGHDYPQGIGNVFRHATFAELKEGTIEINGKKVPTAPMTSYKMSLEIADRLKQWIEDGRFLLTESQQEIPCR